MNEDVRLATYLAERAQSIELAPNDAATITRRAVRRRRRQRALSATAAVVVLVAGTFAIVTRSSSPQSIKAAAGPSVHRTALQWSAVDVPDGLGWSIGTVAASDGSLFSLSTAPGPQSFPTDGTTPPAVLYHSADGRSWETVALPSDLKATTLAASDDHLYAVGTAPGGGGVDIVVASSNDGAQSWSEARIPMPAADLQAQYPNEVQYRTPIVASGPAGLVAAVSVSASPDLNRLLPNDAPFSNGWRFTATGADVFAAPHDCAVQASGATDESIASDASAPPCEAKSASPTVAKSYTWDELHIDPALRAAISGETYLYRSSDGATFEQVGAMPSGLAALVGSVDGYRMLAADSGSSTLRPLFSADGQAWETSGPDLSGWVRASGVLGDAPAVVVEGDGTMNARLLVAGDGGSWTASTITTGPNQYVQDLAIGPLGVVAITSDGTSESLLESTDGVSYRSTPMTDVIGPGNWSVSGVTMNADAVTVRMTPAAAPDGSSPTSPPGPQRLLVGTPG